MREAGAMRRRRITVTWDSRVVKRDSTVLPPPAGCQCVGLGDRPGRQVPVLESSFISLISLCLGSGKC